MSTLIFQGRIFLKFHGQNDQKSLNGKNNLPKKKGCNDKVRMKKIHALTVIENEDVSRSIFTPYYFYEKQVIQNRKDKT